MPIQGELEELLRMRDRGVRVAEAAAALGISTWRAYAVLREAGHGSGPRSTITVQQRARAIATYRSSGSIKAAAAASGLSETGTRPILVSAGLVPDARARYGKAEERLRFLELLAEGWSTSRARREVGVGERTARLWRRGIRKSGDKFIYPDGTVIDKGTRTRYTQVMPTPDEKLSGRYLNLDDRLVIADGLIHSWSMRKIAAVIDKDVSTVSREIAAHRVDGHYLPNQAHRDAVAGRSRAKEGKGKLVEHVALRAEVESGLLRKLSPEQISNRLKFDYPNDESMRVSHETIYRALYVQARGALKANCDRAADGSVNSQASTQRGERQSGSSIR